MTTQGISTLGSRLKQARDAAGLTQRALAEIVGIRQQAVQRIESGEARATSHIVPLAKALNITPEWLALGEGSATAVTVTPTTTKTFMVHEPVKPYHVERVFFAPLLSWNEVSMVSKLPFQAISNERCSFAVSAPTHKKYFVLRIEDDSMSPQFEPSDCIIVDPTVKPSVGSMVVVSYKKSMLLRWYKKEKNKLVLKADNKKYPTIPVDNEISILGTVSVRYTNC